MVLSMMLHRTTDPFDVLDVLDDEIPYPAWMEEDLYDRAEADYNDMLAHGGDL
jgi:hypothetical protein